MLGAAAGAHLGRRGRALPREENRGGLEDLVGAPQLEDLALQLQDALLVGTGHAGTAAAIDLGLGTRERQRFIADAELPGDLGTTP